jgi:hypothetical protein
MSEPNPKPSTPADVGDVNSAAPKEPAASEPLTKEEQWALFEKELKESDWGHQPC